MGGMFGSLKIFLFVVGCDCGNVCSVFGLSQAAVVRPGLTWFRGWVLLEKKVFYSQEARNSHWQVEGQHSAAAVAAEYRQKRRDLKRDVIAFHHSPLGARRVMASSGASSSAIWRA
jgi:hypothetical protein